jgi:hypothetical protein
LLDRDGHALRHAFLLGLVFARGIAREKDASASIELRVCG